MHPASPDNYVNLWDFSLLHYARPGVASACLQLQDEYQANVNLLLWCVWLEQRGLVLDSARLHSAQQRIQVWDKHYVAPLRELRRRMKVEFGVDDAGIEQLRSQIKRAELLAEQQVQFCLEAVVQTWDRTGAHPSPSAGDNLRFYLQQLDVAEAIILQLLDLFSSLPS